MTFFWIDDLRARELLGDRWTFQHPMGAAWVENERYPEAAIAYEGSFIRDLCRSAGFRNVELVPRQVQSIVIARK